VEGKDLHLLQLMIFSVAFRAPATIQEILQYWQNRDGAMQHFFASILICVDQVDSLAGFLFSLEPRQGIGMRVDVPLRIIDQQIAENRTEQPYQDLSSRFLRKFCCSKAVRFM
jgi:hypothetical protein